MILPETIARLRELMAKATPGPWGEYRNGFYGAVYSGGAPVTHSRESHAPCDHEDAELICEMRNALPALLDALESRADAEPSEAQVEAACKTWVKSKQDIRTTMRAALIAAAKVGK